MSKAPGPYQPLSRGVDDLGPYQYLQRGLDDPGPYQPLERGADDPPPYFAVIPSAPAASHGNDYITDDDSALRGRALPTIPPGTSEDAPTANSRVGIPLASKSIDVVCPHCQTSIRTSIEKRPGVLAYLSGALMAVCCCFCGCCLIPCCLEKFMEVKHTCPHCEGLIGKYRL